MFFALWVNIRVSFPLTGTGLAVRLRDPFIT
ncbi:hypothetical protein Ga0123461_0301 [Mariprofundus aestuarium]|uniref:Uncharacterized protein n=1 Tax=Mariprofundus aestuarium TaxID=1921086 RepID=A0A2K8KVH6_MARES|nr:hypothetical protein Ga0123461_0301 [Mariprofundus aestuarium]